MQGFKKNPGIAAFFPRGSVVEFDVNIGDSFYMSAGTGIVKDIDDCGSHVVLYLDILTITKGRKHMEELGESFDQINVSSQHVTAILKRGDGSYADNKQPRLIPRFGFGSRTRVDKRYIRVYFDALFDSRIVESMYGVDRCTMTDAFLDQYPGIAAYRKNFVKRWFWQNVNRYQTSRAQFLQDEKDWDDYMDDVAERLAAED